MLKDGIYPALYMNFQSAATHRPIKMLHRCKQTSSLFWWFLSSIGTLLPPFGHFKNLSSHKVEWKGRGCFIALQALDGDGGDWESKWPGRRPKEINPAFTRWPPVRWLALKRLWLNFLSCINKLESLWVVRGWSAVGSRNRGKGSSQGAYFGPVSAHSLQGHDEVQGDL